MMGDSDVSEVHSSRPLITDDIILERDSGEQDIVDTVEDDGHVSDNHGEAASNKTDGNGTVSNLNRFPNQIRKIIDYFFGDELHLTRIQAAMILLSFSYGSAVIILPYTVLQLGPVTWTLVVAIIVSITAYCAYLNSQCTNYLISESKSVDVLRDPYPALGELAAGPVFRKVVAITMYIAMVSNSLAYVLLSASLLDNAFPFIDWYKYNSVRMWVFIICIPVAPIMFFGSFVDLMGAATFAVSASSVSLFAIFVNCMIARFEYGAKAYEYNPEPPITDNDIFITFGLITFAVSGPSFALPNILVHVSERRKFSHTIAYTFLIILAIYIFSGTLPYAIFGKYTGEMVTETFWHIYSHSNKKNLALPIFTTVCDISMSLHLLLEAILVINPVYQHVEDYLNIPRHINWKRIAVRSCGILSILVICLAFPKFRSVLSIVGGVPLTLVGIIFPLFIHTRIFENNLFTKILHGVLGIFFLVFMIGNFGVSIFSLTQTVLYTSKA